MNQLMENAREIVDECVNTRHCKTCPFSEDGAHCIIGNPMNWRLASNMEDEGFWDPEDEEDCDNVE